MKVLVGLLAVVALRLLAYLPLGLSRWLGAMVGRYNYWAHSRISKITEENLQLCFPEMDAQLRRALMKKSLMNMGKTLNEAASIWLRPYKWLRTKITAVHHQELLARYQAKGKGVIVLAPHLGNWEVANLHLSEFNQMTSLYQPLRLIALEKLIKRGREKGGAKLVPTNRRGVMALLRVLRAGGIVGILPDQVPDEDSGGRFVPFFGQPTFTMRLIYNLICRTGCLVVIVYAKRVNGGFEVVYREVDAAMYSKDELVALAAMNKSIEDCVRDSPEQYLWGYKRFKKCPEGVAKRYQF